MQPIIGNFRILRPKYEISQVDGLNWIMQAHALSKYLENSFLQNKKTLPELKIYMENYINRFGCKPDKIENRATSIDDYSHQNWEEMSFFDLKKNTSGAFLHKRMEFYSQVVNEIVVQFYNEIEIPPAHLIHVTCTGYSSPSSAQRLVSHKGWGNKTKVTHAYHMGCYASLPALRIGHGFILQENQFSLFNNEEIKNNRIDIVHTELCTLHFNPSLHDPSQIVVQSLFADGFIHYSLFDENYYNNSDFKNGLQVLINHEEILSHSTDAMSWDLDDHGFQMELSGKVPSIIAENIEKFIIGMSSKIGLDFNEVKNNALFAIHPGGPKIIQFIKDILVLNESSIKNSEEVLKKYGNMSSATLPHIWESVLKSNPKKGTFVYSLAFGPGLTISGSIMSIV